MSEQNLTHLDSRGQAAMVDISAKPDTVREATAEALLVMAPATLSRIVSGDLPKGEVIATARIAAIQAAKRTADLIPLCHPLALSRVAAEFSTVSEDTLRITVTCRLTGKTGVEMEALTGASVAALTVYDMCKAVDRDMEIRTVRLLSKQGGQRGDYQRGDA